MDNGLIDKFSGGDDLRQRRTVSGVYRPRLAVSSPAAHRAYSCFPYSTSAPFQYTPYNLYSSLSLPLQLPSHHAAALLPLPPATMGKHGTFPHRPPPPRWATASKAIDVMKTGVSTAAPVAAARTIGEYKRKNPRTPRSSEEPPRAQRRKQLERAAPLPPALAVAEALDDLEKEVARGFVEDLLHALAPPPSSLPLPTFSLVRAAAGKAAGPCNV